MNRGVTLVELIVVVAMLGLLAGVSGLALHSLRTRPRSPAEESITRARRDAIHRGEAVRLYVRADGAHHDHLAHTGT